MPILFIPNSWNKLGIIKEKFFSKEVLAFQITKQTEKCVFILFFEFWLWLSWVCVAAWALLSSQGAGVRPQLPGTGFSSRWPLSLPSTGSRVRRLQQSRLMGSVDLAVRLQSAGPAVASRGFSHCEARGILPDQGSELCLLLRWVDSLLLSRQGGPKKCVFSSCEACDGRESEGSLPALPDGRCPRGLWAA